MAGGDADSRRVVDAKRSRKAEDWRVTTPRAPRTGCGGSAGAPQRGGSAGYDSADRSAGTCPASADSAACSSSSGVFNWSTPLRVPGGR